MTEEDRLAGLIAVGGATGGLVTITDTAETHISYEVTLAPFQLRKLLKKHPSAVKTARAGPIGG